MDTEKTTIDELQENTDEDKYTTPEFIKKLKESKEKSDTEANDHGDDQSMGSFGKKSIYETLEEDIFSSDIPGEEKLQKLSRLYSLRSRKVNILVTGATGVGKSSTINALFNTEVAKVGVGVDPETSLIECYQLDNLTIWDTPGLGDDVETDKEIKQQIINKLNEKDEDGNFVIDLVLVLLDASSKDMGTAFDLINDVLRPCLEEEASKRIIVALNQADIAMKGRHWDREKNVPDEKLEEYLEKKTASAGERIREATGLQVEPIFFCAGYMEEGDEAEKRRPYNLTKLLYYIVKAVPKDKRLALVDNLNDDGENWIYDDEKEDYMKATSDSFLDSVINSFLDGEQDGIELGDMLLGIPGGLIGAFVGGAFGIVRGVVGSLFGERY